MQLLVLLTFSFSKLLSKYATYGGYDTFLNDLRACLQLSRCDQLVILDGPRSLEAFSGKAVMNRKFEILASAGHDVASPGANMPHWLTRTLNDVLERLLKESPKGFSTSHVYDKLCSTGPFDKPCRPLLFDQGTHDLGRIWLRPHVQHAPSESQENRRYLNLRLKLDGDPEPPMMSEILSYLQRLPHVEQVELGDLSLPRERLTDFTRMVVQAQKIRPLIRRIVARRHWSRIRRMVAKRHSSGIANLRKAYPHGTTIPFSLEGFTPHPDSP